jgi:hypothetical protein
MSHPSPSSYDVGYPRPSHQTISRKRSHQEDHHLQQELPTLEQQLNPYAQATGSVSLAHPGQGYSLQQYQTPQTPQSTLPPTHHHHMPNQHRNKRHHTMEGAPPSPTQHHGPPSVVGQEGMPPPAARPRGPKLKFTPEDDQLLVDLKEKKNLTWKQIADFFPGRSSGTLQVRYCTKLKAKTTVWTDEMVSPTRCSCILKHATSCVAGHRNSNMLTAIGITGRKAAQRYAGVRKRSLAHHLLQGRQWLLACCMQRKGFRARRN